VKWFNPRKRYGFIVAEEGEEVFFHQRQILGGNEEEASEGQAVEFHVRDTLKGLEALNIELIGG
jgi:CspA family cold shock protein